MIKTGFKLILSHLNVYTNTKRCIEVWNIMWFPYSCIYKFPNPFTKLYQTWLILGWPSFKTLSDKYFYIFIGVIEWLLLNANSAIFQLYHGENKLIFNEMMMRSALTNCTRPTRSWILIVKAHWNNSLLVDMSFHSDTLFWFWVNQSLLFSP